MGEGVGIDGGEGEQVSRGLGRAQNEFGIVLDEPLRTSDGLATARIVEKTSYCALADLVDYLRFFLYMDFGIGDDPLDPLGGVVEVRSLIVAADEESRVDLFQALPVLCCERKSGTAEQDEAVAMSGCIDIEGNRA